jgi:putative hydroxymethylpyrimidine transport system substrate-binding protein
MPLRVPLLAVAALAALLAAGCGGSSSASGGSPQPPKLVVALDFTPNAVHAPIYEAIAHGRDRAHGVRLDVKVPGAGPDSVKLVASGKVDLGVLDIQDLALARERGIDLVGIGALVGRPLAALVAEPDIHRPRDLDGHSVGVSGLPSDPAFLKAVLGHDGGNYGSVKQVTIGFNAVGALLAHKVSAVPAFWNAEGVALRQRGLDVNEFRIEDYGAPRYPEVILMTSRKTLEQHRDRLAAALAAIDDGRKLTIAHPDDAAKVIAHVAQARDDGLVRAQVDAVHTAFAPGLRLDKPTLERWADFDTRVGIVDRRPDVDSSFDFSLRP